MIDRENKFHVYVFQLGLFVANLCWHYLLYVLECFFVASEIAVSIVERLSKQMNEKRANSAHNNQPYNNQLISFERESERTNE